MSGNRRGKLPERDCELRNLSGYWDSKRSAECNQLTQSCHCRHHSVTWKGTHAHAREGDGCPWGMAWINVDCQEFDTGTIYLFQSNCFQRKADLQFSQ